jgi:hypothetical protein
VQQEDPEFDTPILFLIFNRPDLTEKVFGQIRKIRPKQLFIGADGPRKDKPGEDEKCQATRQLVLDMIDWDCEVKTLFREENLGCGLAVSQAITWFFEHVEMGIILEDDILTDTSFYSFLSQMLKCHSSDQNVLFVSGSNFQLGYHRGDGDFYYSKFPNTWGWATWKDRWELFNFDLEINERLIGLLDKKIKSKKLNRFWQCRLQAIKKYRAKIWDYQWFINIYLHEKWSVVPNKSLVRNIGIGEEQATNTHSFSSNYSRIVLEEFFPPYRFPNEKYRNYNADAFHFDKFFNSKTSLVNHFRNIAYQVFPAEVYQLFKKLLGRSSNS